LSKQLFPTRHDKKNAQQDIKYGLENVLHVSYDATEKREACLTYTDSISYRRGTTPQKENEEV
jgi:hypothetical protein